MRGLLRTFIRPKNLTLEQFGEQLLAGMGGGSIAGVPVTVNTSLRIATVWSCQRLLAETVAGLKFESFERLKPRGQIYAPDHPIGKVIRRPNPEQTPFQFMEFGMMRLLNDGNAYYRINWMRNGRPGELWPITGTVVPERPDPRGPIRYSVFSPSRPEGQDILSEILDAEDVLHVAGLAFNGLVGMSPLDKAREMFGLALAQEQHGSQTFNNGARVSGIVTHPGIMKDKLKQSFREEWRDAYEGVQNAGKVAILERGMTYQSIGLSNANAQFLESRGFSGQDIARFYRVAPHMVGFLDAQPRANMEQIGREFVDFSLDPWLYRFSQAFEHQLYLERDQDKYFLAFDVSDLLKADFKTRMEGYGIARNWGILNVDESRAKEGMNPVEGGAGKKYIRPGNMIPLESDESQMTESPGTQRGVKQPGDVSDRERTMIRNVAKRTMRRAAGALQRLEKGSASLEETEKQLKSLAKFVGEAFCISEETADRITSSYAAAAKIAVEQSKISELVKAFEEDDGANLAQEVLDETQA